MADSPERRRHGGGKQVIDLAGQQIGGVLALDRAEKPATRSFSSQQEAWCRCLTCSAEVVMASSRVG